MSTQTGWMWEYGGAGTGLHFTITYDTNTETFTVTSLEGSFDLNALWWNDGVADGAGVKLAKSDSALNMNGSGEDWDGMGKLSNAGLGTAGETKSTFISDGETGTQFTLAQLGLSGDFKPETGGTLGVRATSVNGGDSIKLVDKEPVVIYDEEEEDHFPEWVSPAISHVTFYFETSVGDIDGIWTTGKNGDNLPDGWYTFKFDVQNGPLGQVSNDLDDWYDAALAYIVTQNPGLNVSTVQGVSIKGGQDEIWYAIDNDPLDVDVAPSVWKVEGPELDAEGFVSYNGVNDIYLFSV